MMGILVAAVLATAIAAAIVLPALCWRRLPSERRFLLVIVLVNLPLNALAFHGVRMPVEHWLSDALAAWPGLLTAIRLCYAPLTEEPAKLLVFCIPWVWRQVQRSNLPQVALAVGLGFGVGEAWMIAHLLSSKPEIAALPWYGLLGFVFERVVVCFIHAAFTSVALLGLVRRRFGIALVMIGAAMLWHFLVNFPLYLAGTAAFGLGKDAWSIMLMCWIPLCTIAAVLWLAHVAGWSLRHVLVPGRARCPSCGVIYQPSLLLSLNFFDRRYERCPACKKWHLIALSDRVPR